VVKIEINNEKQNSFEKLIDEAKKELEKQKLQLVNKSLNIENILQQQQQNNINDIDGQQSSNNVVDENQNLSQNEIELQENLTNINVEIDLKERLIVELEEQKSQFNLMKYYYEEKLDVLNDRMHKIESERDNIIDNYSKFNQSVGNDEKIKKVKIDYELKLKNLSQEIQKYTNLKQKHQQMLKQQQENEKQIEQMNRELVEMKKFKIKLLKQLKVETTKYKSDEKNYLKEIQTLKRDHAKKDSQIRNLNEENKRKCVILKRKQEQIQALSKQQRQIFTNKVNRMASNIMVPSTNTSTNSSYSQKLNQFKWQNIENNVSIM
jgi:kinesin family member 21